MPDVYTVFNIPPQRAKKSRYKKFTLQLSQRHRRLKKVIDLIGSLDYEVPIWPSINDAVLYAVIGQMLSIVAAKSIITRLQKKFESSENIMRWAKSSLHHPGALMGVSWRKRKALAEWYKYFSENCNQCLQWNKAPLEVYRWQITSVWGLGSWSADMISIFYLGRMDVWPSSDMGIKNACKNVFGTDDYSKIKKYVCGCETVASLYLWELINRKITV